MIASRPASSGARVSSAASNRDATASSWRTCPKVNARRNVPNVEGARMPANSRRIPPWRSRSKSVIESAPATIPSTTATSLVTVFAAGTVNRSASSR